MLTEKSEVLIASIIQSNSLYYIKMSIKLLKDYY